MYAVRYDEFTESKNSVFVQNNAICQLTSADIEEVSAGSSAYSDHLRDIGASAAAGATVAAMVGAEPVAAFLYGYAAGSFLAAAYYD